MGCRTLHIFTQRSSATQWLLCSTEMLPTCTKITTWPLSSGIYCPEWELAGPWQLLRVLLSNTQRLSWSLEQHSRGGGNNLCLERAETICSSGSVAGNTRGLLFIPDCPFLQWARVKGCCTRRWHTHPSPFPEVGSVLSTGVVSPLLHDQEGAFSQESSCCDCILNFQKTHP